MLINVIVVHKKLPIKHIYHNCTEGIQIQTSVHRIIYSTSFGDVKEILYKTQTRRARQLPLAVFPQYYKIMTKMTYNYIQLLFTISNLFTKIQMVMLQISMSHDNHWIFECWPNPKSLLSSFNFGHLPLYPS